MAIRRWDKPRGLRQARRLAPCPRSSRRELRLETLEDRIVLASPQLVGINPNVGELLQEGDVLNVAPQELTFRFDEGQSMDPATLGGIVITRGGPDGQLDDNGDGNVDGNDSNVVVQPGFAGLGDTENLIIIRFAGPLPDDQYQIDVIGSGASALRNQAGEAFDADPATAGNQNFRRRFRLDLGAQVVAVVPQPVTRDAGGALTQVRDQIVVYFKDADMDVDSVSDPDFYQLILTEDTVANTDDTVFVPSQGSPPVYDAAANSVTLTFDDLPQLAGTMRLRVGTSEAVPLPPAEQIVDEDPGSSFATADDLLADYGFSFEPGGDGRSRTIILSSAIDPQPFVPDLPGSNQDPGHRQIPFSTNQHVPDDSADPIDGISEFAYSFPTVYALDSGGSPLLNQITERQKDRAREVFELYESYLGVQFYETLDQGFRVVTGALSAVDPFVSVENISSIAGNILGFGPTVVLDASEAWNDQFGSNWFRETATRVGQLLGLGGTFDLPPGTLMGSDSRLTFGTGPERVFPGDHDIVHGQHLYRPDSNDIDLYRFTIPESLGAGLFSAQTIAERQVDSSLLDTVLRLYRQTDDGRRELVAQNDDYFSDDSFLEIVLEPGTYFVGVSASGNDRYNPAIEDSGFGGLSQGVYDLRLGFRPNADASIVDVGGVALDGDSDGQPGGVFNFWFKTQPAENTMFVDKTFAGVSTGSLLAPYRNIAVALEAASSGDIVRIVGNGGADGDLATLDDNLAYQIGVSAAGGDLPDGRTMAVPQDVTVMIDAGAIFKMRRSVISVGSSSPAVDRSDSALQILGTPDHAVYFTSTNDESIGVDTTPTPTSPSPGDWGGIILRNDVDQDENRTVLENEGIFLNTISQADLRYGGGTVVLNAGPTVINPVHIIRSRPTVSFSEITNSADAAMSASPDSFLETTFHSPSFQSTPFTSDYDRVGPSIHNDRLVDNTTNGLFVRIPRLAGDRLRPMTVSGRWNDTHVVHVLADNLTLQGTPGGPVEGESGIRTARTDARLSMDPGTVVKMEGARIEARMGADVYAEGTAEARVVITALGDDRYGAGGTFDTNSNASVPEPGDWGGVLLNPTGIGSMDHAVVAFGGGITPFEGSFAGVNAVELYQARGRIVNSVFENNASGTGPVPPAFRFGRGLNDPATVFVRGAQPVIVNNNFRGNDSPVVNINVNALNHLSVVDTGRATGQADVIVGFLDNQGPLIRNNLVGDNSLNALEVRGGTLTTESVWDDTDMVHVLRDTIYVPNFHTFGGLRLESSPSESLVVKLLGQEAGVTTTGTALEIEDLIGGRVQVIGQPGHPVVLTSLFDDTVGAGFDENGQPQSDTNGGGRPVRSNPEDTFQIDLNFGPLISQNPDAVQAALRAASIWEMQLQDPMTVVVDVEFANFGAAPVGATDPDFLMQTIADRVSLNFNSVRSALATDAGDHEPLATELPLNDQINVDLPNDPTNPFTVARTMELTRANAKALGFSVGIGTDSEFDPLGREVRDGRININDDPDLWDYQRRDGLWTYREDFLSNFMRELGEILGFTSSVDFVQAALNDANISREIELTPLDLFRFAPGQGNDDFTDAVRMLNPLVQDHVFFAGGSFDPDVLDLPISGLEVGDIPLASGRVIGDELNELGAGHWLDDVFVREGKLTEFTPIGIMDPINRWRDQLIQLNDPIQNTLGLITDITEQDREAFDTIGYDVVGAAPGQWQGIRMERLTHDANAAVVLEGESTETSAPGTNATPETAQFMGRLASDLKAGDDNQRLAFEIHGTLNEPGDVDVYSFAAVAGTPIWLDIDRTATTLDSVVELIDVNGTVLARSDNSFLESDGSEPLFGVLNPQPLGSFDHYSTNTHDAGMQVTLPGVADTDNNYLVRVRSSSPDLDGDLTGGLTSGQYQLQVRLRSADEIPGTAVQFADIRYADSAIQIIGPPVNSPLAGEHVEDQSYNDAFEELSVQILDDEGMPIEDAFVEHGSLPFEVSPQNLGNLLTTDQGTLSVFGDMSGFGDVDWFEFQIDFNALGNVPGQFDFREAGVVLDIDYASSLGRANTALSVFDFGGSLIYYSEQGTVPDDLPAVFSGGEPDPDNPNDLNDLSRGSVSTQDPYIGPIALDEGTYYAVVSPISWVPPAIAAGTAALEPIIGDGVERGLRVTNPSFGTVFVPNPNAPPGETSNGEYQLEIRYTPVPAGGFDSSNADVADKNRERIQGQIIIDSNSISHSRQWGIAVEDALRDMPNYSFFLFDQDDPDSEIFSLRRFAPQPHGQFTEADYAPHGTPPRALPTLDEERIVPGLTFKNNVISGGIEGGIQMHGDPDGIVINTYALDLLVNIVNGLDAEGIEGAEFTIWDHQRNSATFEFTMDDAVLPGHIPVRFDLDPGNDGPSIVDEFRRAGIPTSAFAVASEIEHAIRTSDLDVKIYRGDFESLFVEGAIEIGHPDVFPVPRESVFFPGDPTDPDSFSALPIITAFVAQQGPVPFARIANNTIVGRAGELFEASGDGDIGVLIEDNASPTLLNNIIANFDTAMLADLTSTDDVVGRRTFISGNALSQSEFAVTTVFEMALNDPDFPLRFLEAGHGFAGAFRNQLLTQDIDTDPTKYVAPRPTVIGATLYQGNAVDNTRLGDGDFPIRLQIGDPLFVDPSNGNFLLEEGSRAIDSSVDRLGERDRLAAIKAAVGIADSDILAPETDVRGQRRVDDPSVEPPAGFGENVFVDRGALDRVDFSGPSAVLSNPVDNDAAGNDRNPLESVVRLVGRTLSNFSIRLVDGIAPADPSEGTGANDLTVTSNTVVVTRDGAVLLDGVDYRFAYDKTNDIIRLSSLSGIWAPGREYVITLSGIEDMAGNELKPNQLDGTTRFTIDLDRTSDFGDAPDPPYPTRRVPTGQNPEGASHNIVDGFFLGASVSSDTDGQPNQGATGDDFDDGVELVDAVVPGSETMIRVTATGSGGLLNAWIDFDADGGWESPGSGDNPVEQVFVNQPLTPGVNTLSVAVPADAVEGFTFARFRFSTESDLTPAGAAADGEVEDYIYFVGEAGAAPWQNPANPLDVNADGDVTAQDVLTVFNDLNNPNNGARELPNPPVPPDTPPPFLDVNGDGFVTPVDALIIINFLNLAPAVGASQTVATATASLDDTGLLDHDAVGSSGQESGPSESITISPFVDALTIDFEQPSVVRADQYDDTLGIGRLSIQGSPLRNAPSAPHKLGSVVHTEPKEALNSRLISSTTDPSSGSESLDEVLPEIAEEIAIAWQDGSEENGIFH